MSIVTSVCLLRCVITLMLLPVIDVLGRGSSTRGTEARGGRRRDATRLNTRRATLTDITLGPTLLERGITSTVGMALEREVDIMVGALDPPLPIGTQSMVFRGKLHAVGEHVYLGLHDVLIAMPRVANEQDQLRERGHIAVVHRVGAQEEGDEGAEGLKENVEVRFPMVIDHTVNEKREFR